MGYILRIVGGELDGRVVPVPADRPITLGRGSNNDVQIHDKKLSRTHCQIMVSQGKCVVTDLNSTNGTYVGGERVEERAMVPADVVTIGMTTLKVAYREEEEPPPAPGSGARCVECGKPISRAALDAGTAKIVGNRAYCEECRIGAVPPREAAPGGEEVMPVELDVELAPGEKFAGYTIGERLRSTLYGAQFKATKKQLGNPVMVVLLRTTDVDWANKFLHACYQAAALIHPNILLLYETGEDGGRFYYAMEFVEAQTVEELLAARGALAHDEAFPLVDQVAHAVAYASEKHILHGTLAPSNIYVRSDHTCKVGEFGLAALPLMSPALWPFPLPILPYRAPEQLRHAVTPSIEGDVYALGAIFYHMLAGKPPYQGKAIEEVRAQVLAGKLVPVGEVVPDLPDMTRKIIERCMAPSPSGRYQTARELLNDFEYAARGGP